MINISHRKRKGENIFRETATINKKMCFPIQEGNGSFRNSEELNSSFESMSVENFNRNQSNFPQVTYLKPGPCVQCQAGQSGHINHLKGS